MPRSAASPRHISIPACLKWLFSDPRWPSNLAIGSLWTLASLLILPMPVLWGYGFRVEAATVANPDAPPPRWCGLGRLYLDGLKVFLVLVAHWGPVALCVWAAIGILGTIGVRLPEPGDESPWLGVLLLVVIGLVSWPFLCVAFYVLTASARLAVTGRLAAAFEPRVIVQLMRRNITNYALSFLVLLVTSMVAQFGPCLCCIGIFPVGFWSQVCLCRALGLIVAYDPAPQLVDRPGAV
jgi:hypothetical protein